MTRIDPEVYLKRIDLKKKPPAFRTVNNNQHTHHHTFETVHPSQLSTAQQVDEQEKLKLRKRHKSTGHEAYSDSNMNSSAASGAKSQGFVLKMNKSALETKLGQLLSSQNIHDENQLNSFILSNVTKNVNQNNNITY